MSEPVMHIVRCPTCARYLLHVRDVPRTIVATKCPRCKADIALAVNDAGHVEFEIS